MSRQEAPANDHVAFPFYLRHSLRLRIVLGALLAMLTGGALTWVFARAFEGTPLASNLGLSLGLALVCAMLVLAALLPTMLRPVAYLSARLREVRSGPEARELRPAEYIELAPLVEAAVAFLDRAENQQNLAAAIRQASRQRVERMAEEDALTGLHNRYYLQTILPHKMAHARNANDFLSAVMLDVDHFKHYNDTNGHLEGDHVLARIAEILRRSVRQYDICCRYGGEEFVILLPGANPERAALIADRIRNAIAQAPFTHGETQPLGRVTASFGVATFPTHALEPKDLLDRADQALYFSKKSGRNRVHSYDAVQAQVEVDDLDLPESTEVG